MTKRLVYSRKGLCASLAIAIQVRGAWSAQVEASRAVDVSENWMAWNYNPREAGPGAQGESLAYAPLVQCNN